MYTIKIPHKNYKGQPRTKTVELNLDVREVVHLLVEFNTILKWIDTKTAGEERELEPHEVVEYYDNLETILLAAWGELSDDGDNFYKHNRYEKFETTKLYTAVMETFVSDPAEANKMVNALMPEGMNELVKKSEGNLEAMKNNPDTSDEMRREIERLQAELAAKGDKKD